MGIDVYAEIAYGTIILDSEGDSSDPDIEQIEELLWDEKWDGLELIVSSYFSDFHEYSVVASGTKTLYEVGIQEFHSPEILLKDIMLLGEFIDFCDNLDHVKFDTPKWLVSVSIF